MKTPSMLKKKVGSMHTSKTDIVLGENRRRDEVISKTQLKKFINVARTAKLQTPYMITDTSILQEKCITFKAVFPDVKLYYAIKCFGDPEVIKAVNTYVDGYDVASVFEIEKLIGLGVDPRRMAFSNPVKSEQTIQRAAKLGVHKFAYQSQNELMKIKKYSPHAEVYLRMQVVDDTSSISFSSKFGCDFADAKDLLLLARKLGLNPIGVTFHVGSQATVNNVWEDAIERCSLLMHELESEDLRLSVINLGGGFPVRYTSTDPTIEEVGAIVNTAIQERLSSKDVALMAEPGRYIAADSSVIVATIIGVEERGDSTWLFLDVGTFQAFAEVFEFGYFPYPVYSVEHLISDLQPKSTKKYVLTGPTCDSYDTMSLGVQLPGDLAVGHRILIGVAGAYTIEYGSNFNGFVIPPRQFID